MDDRLLRAAANNAGWCDLVCRSHAIPTATEPDVWFALQRAPELYPDAVTLQPGVVVEDALRSVQDGPGCSMKDSFPQSFPALVEPVVDLQTCATLRWEIRSRKARRVIDFVIETEILRPPADVFAYVTDATKLASWQTNTVSAVAEQPGPIGLGSRIREVHRAPGGKEFAELVEVVEYEPDQVFGMRVVEGQPIHGRISFEQTERGTRFRFRVYGQPTGVMRLSQPVLRPMMKRSFAGYCATLKRVLESASSEP